MRFSVCFCTLSLIFVINKVKMILVPFPNHIPPKLPHQYCLITICSFYSKNVNNKHQTPQLFQDKNIVFYFYKLKLLLKQQRMNKLLNITNYLLATYKTRALG